MISSRSLFLSAAVLLLSTAVIAADDSDVLKLTSANFDDVIKRDGIVFVKFFAPWCGHCKSMAEDFKNTATELKGKAILADVDATIEEDLAKKFNIEGFPTLKLFQNGEELSDYSGSRDKDSMIKFVERAHLPPYESLDDEAAYKKFMKENSAKSILISADIDGSALAKFKKASFGLRDILSDSIAFGVAKSADIVDIKGMSKGDVFVLRVEADGSQKPIKYDSESGETIEKFVKAAALPAFQEFSQENAELYTELTSPLIVGFFEDCTSKDCKIMEKVANKKLDNGKVVFAWVNGVTLSSFKEYVGLEKADPAICAYSFESDARYMLPDDFKMSEENFEAWVDDMIAGNVKRVRKSEEIPETNEGPVYTVVGDSWADIVEDPEKDVIIAQVAEWCGHCNALKPIYRKVAEELKKAGVDHIKFAMMDATENDAPDAYKAKGFPTIHFFPAGKEQKGVDFDGERTGKAIIEWLMKNTTTKFEFDVESLGEDPAPEEEEEDEEYGDEEEEDFEDEEPEEEEKEDL